MKRLVAIILILFAAVWGVVAMDHPTGRADLTIIIPVDVFTLDPQKISYNQDIRMGNALYEGIVRWDNDTFEVEPAIAQSWEVSPDGRTYTFHLTDRAKWSNGDPVTAHDFVYAWSRALFPETAGDYTETVYFPIAGAPEFFQWRTAQLEAYAALPSTERTEERALSLYQAALQQFDDTVAIKALDDHTLQVSLTNRVPFFLDLCAFVPMFPVHRATVEDPRWWSVDPETAMVRVRPDWTKPAHWVSNGPYILKEWRFKRELVIEKNPNYWRPQQVRSRTIKFLPINDKNTSVLAYQTGVADWHSDVQADYVADMIDQNKRAAEQGLPPANDMQVYPAYGTYFWWFNCEPTLPDGRDNPFFDPRVRRAFVLATDRQAIVDLRRRGETPAQVFVPPGSIPGFESPRGIGFDPQRARDELRAAGWYDRDNDGIPDDPRGNRFPDVVLLYSTGTYHVDVAQAMSAMWRDTLGVRTELVGKESKIYKEDLKKRNYMLARGGWYGDYGDPTTFLNLHRSTDGQNESGYNSSTLDNLLAQAETETDPDKRYALLEEAERFTMDEEVPILTLWHYAWYYLFKSPETIDGKPQPGGLRNFSAHPRQTQFVWELEVVK